MSNQEQMAKFRKLVNKHIRQKAGLSLDDLADFDLWPYLDLAELDQNLDGLAKEAAEDLLHSEGFPAEDFT